MPSVRRGKQIAIFALCSALGAGGLTGCETTQEKAAAQRAESERILEARTERRQEKKRHHQHKHEKGKG